MPDIPPPAPRRQGQMPVVPPLEPPPAAVARSSSMPPPPPPTSTSTIPPPRSSAPPPTIPPLGRNPSGVASSSDGRALSTTLAGLTRVGDAARDHLPPVLRSRLERVPGAALLGASALLAALVLVGLGVGTKALVGAIAKSDGAQTANEREAVEKDESAAATTEAPAPPQATEDRPAASAKPVEKPGDEAAMLLHLADSLLTQRRDADVPLLVERLITRYPELKKDEHVGRLLMTTAALTDRRAASDSYTLLTGPMGEPGAALMYELSVNDDVRDGVRKRAERWLDGKDFERTAALPVYAAVKLRNAKSCEDKRGLLEFATQAGGKYVLSYLHELDQKTLCAPNDLEHCYPCMRNDSQLTDAIAKLERH